jgi:hypothetical protein
MIVKLPSCEAYSATYGGLLLLHWGARWAWGTRGLPQEVRRPLHRSVWVLRELCVEGIRHCERPWFGSPEVTFCKIFRLFKNQASFEILWCVCVSSVECGVWCV